MPWCCHRTSPSKKDQYAVNSPCRTPPHHAIPCRITQFLLVFPPERGLNEPPPRCKQPLQVLARPGLSHAIHSRPFRSSARLLMTGAWVCNVPASNVPVNTLCDITGKNFDRYFP